VSKTIGDTLRANRGDRRNWKHNSLTATRSRRHNRWRSDRIAPSFASSAPSGIIAESRGQAWFLCNCPGFDSPAQRRANLPRGYGNLARAISQISLIAVRSLRDPKN